jgi:oligopeptide/dipeptide ABC transporter ATP-binding protein
MDVLHARGDALQKIRRGMQVVFQDPFGSLNPRKKVRTIIEEPMIVHKTATSEEIRERTFQLIDMVGLSRDMLHRYPHEFSGGQRQRICIARALAINPSLIICDEPVSALDVSIQAQVINLLTDLQARLKLSYLFISHNLSVVGYISQRIAVMYEGRIVELAQSQALFERPLHPYTQCLIEAVPEPLLLQNTPTRRMTSAGNHQRHNRAGCAYLASCTRSLQECSEASPALTEIETGHFVACHGPG